MTASETFHKEINLKAKNSIESFLDNYIDKPWSSLYCLSPHLTDPEFLKSLIASVPKLSYIRIRLILTSLITIPQKKLNEYKVYFKALLKIIGKKLYFNDEDGKESL